MISRNWRGLVRSEEADNYIRHLQQETFPQLARLDGFVSASILRRETDRGVEFLIMTLWESMAAIRQFAGEPVHVAVVPPAAQAMMVEYDREVAHYEVAETGVPSRGF
jgi:heme-degrading monooxygenase HmoA